jgi:hypothetical protein
MINAQQFAIRTLLLNVNLPSADKNSYMTASEVSARQAEFFQKVGQPAGVQSVLATVPDLIRHDLLHTSIALIQNGPVLSRGLARTLSGLRRLIKPIHATSTASGCPIFCRILAR